MTVVRKILVVTRNDRRRNVNMRAELKIDSDIVDIVDVFWTFLLRNGDEMVKTVYVKKSTAFKMVYDEYESYAVVM